jgi:hypothetical protein
MYGVSQKWIYHQKIIKKGRIYHRKIIKKVRAKRKENKAYSDVRTLVLLQNLVTKKPMSLHAYSLEFKGVRMFSGTCYSIAL